MKMFVFAVDGRIRHDFGNEKMSGHCTTAVIFILYISDIGDAHGFQHDTLHCLCRSRESGQPCHKSCHLVGHVQTDIVMWFVQLVQSMYPDVRRNMRDEYREGFGMGVMLIRTLPLF